MPKVEFLREAGPEAPPVFFDRVLVPPTGRLAPDPRLRFLMTSVFKLSGRTTPWSFKNKPQALQSGCPSGLRRQSGVVCVKQFVQVVGALPSAELPAAPCKFVVDPCFDPSGEEGRLGLTEENPEALPAASVGGELGFDCANLSKRFPRLLVLRPETEALRGIFCRLSPALND